MKRMTPTPHLSRLRGRLAAGDLLLALCGGAALAEEAPELDCVILPHKEVDVHSAVPGIIQSINVERSDSVAKGQVLVQLEAGVEQATLDLARARAEIDTEIHLRDTNLDFDQRRHQRAQTLYDTKVMSTDARDEAARNAALSEWELRMAQDKKKLAELEMERARAVLALRTIRSPLSGVVSTRYRSPGEYVEDQAILRIAQLDPLRVEIIAPVSMFGQIRKGMRVEVRPETAPEQSYSAKVSIVDAVADPASGTFGVRLELPNPGHKLLGGIKCKSRFTRPVISSAAPATAATAKPLALTQSAAPAGIKAQCLAAGPLRDAEQAARAQAALRALSVEASPRQATERADRGFTVATSPQATAEARRALAAELSDKGIDDQMIMDTGRFRNRIALGYYNGRAWAERRQAQLAELGYATDIIAAGAATTQWWLDIAANATVDEQQLLHALAEYAPEAGLQKRACAALNTVAAR